MSLCDGHRTALQFQRRPSFRLLLLEVRASNVVGLRLGTHPGKSDAVVDFWFLDVLANAVGPRIEKRGVPVVRETIDLDIKTQCETVFIEGLTCASRVFAQMAALDNLPLARQSTMLSPSTISRGAHQPYVSSLALPHHATSRYVSREGNPCFSDVLDGRVKTQVSPRDRHQMRAQREVSRN